MIEGKRPHILLHDLQAGLGRTQPHSPFDQRLDGRAGRPLAPRLRQRADIEQPKSVAFADGVGDRTSLAAQHHRCIGRRRPNAAHDRAPGCERGFVFALDFPRKRHPGIGGPAIQCHGQPLAREFPCPRNYGSNRSGLHLRTRNAIVASRR